MKNYYILDRDIATANNELIALESCIGENYTQRYSLNYRKILIKTYDNLTFEGIMAYTEEQILELMNTIEWSNYEELV